MTIAFITSGWHLSNLCAYVAESNKMVDILVINQQSNISNKSRFRIKKAQLEKLDIFEKTQIIYGRPKLKLTTGLINLLNIILFRKTTEIISPGDINITSLFSLKIKGFPSFTIIDEGTASYVSQAQHRKIAQKSSDKKGNTYITNFIKDFFRNILRRLTKVEDRRLFKLKKNNFVVQNHVKSALKNYYTKANLDTRSSKPSAIILMDFIEYFGDHQYFEHLFKILYEKLNEKYSTYIKKHPNDLNTYSWITKSMIVENNTDAEDLIRTINPKIVIGGISTSTFTIPAIYDIKTICILPLYLDCKNIDNDYKIRFQQFIEYSSNLVELPKTIKEFIETI